MEDIVDGGSVEQGRGARVGYCALGLGSMHLDGHERTINKCGDEQRI